MPQRFKVIHPFHPLCGRELNLLGYRNSWKRTWIDYIDDKNVCGSLPLSWTDVAGEDPFLLMSKGRSVFRVEELIRLSDLVKDLKPGRKK